MSQQGAKPKTTPNKKKTGESVAKTPSPSGKGASSKTPSKSPQKSLALAAMLKEGENVGTFCKMFWKGTNGNDVIDELNKYPVVLKEGKRDYIRREKNRPYIYCIVLNYDFGGSLGEWRFCKVGITLVDGGEDDRVKIVEDKIEKENTELFKTERLFRLPIRAIDTNNIYATERRIRGNMGFKVEKKLAKVLDLPISTEWALTTKTFIGEVKEEADKENTDTYIFKNSLNEVKGKNVKQGEPPSKIKYKDREHDTTYERTTYTYTLVEHEE